MTPTRTIDQIKEALALPDTSALSFSAEEMRVALEQQFYFGMDTALAAPAAPLPAQPEQSDELHFNAQRLRNVAKLVGLESAVPQDDATLDGARGSVLGQIARKLREGQSGSIRPSAEPAGQHEANRSAWEYSFIHSSATGRGDSEIGPCLTYDRSIAFGVGCMNQRAVFVSSEQTSSAACAGPTTLPKPFFYYRANPDGSPEWGEDCVCQDPVYDHDDSALEDRFYSGKVYSEEQVRALIAAASPSPAPAYQTDPKGGLDIDDVISELGIADEVAAIRVRVVPAQQQEPKCAMCNDHGSVGRAPDDYYPCPDCSPETAAPGASTEDKQ